MNIRKRIKEFKKKYSWYPLAINYIVVVLMFILLISNITAHIQAKNCRNREIAMAEALSNYKEELAKKEADAQAAILAEQQSETAKRETEIRLMAKMFSGIDAFVEKYGYSERDLRTYGECVINRCISQKNGFPNTIAEVILQEKQWTGFSENNSVIDRYYQIASTVINGYYDGNIRPCSSEFCWAELRSDGIWLKNEYSDSKYVSTWRYSL